MVKKVKHMSKYFLTFNLYCFFAYNLNGQDVSNVIDSTSLDESRSILNIESEQAIYPGKPLLMSLILPGAGQYYNNAPLWKTSMFFGFELASIVTWNYFKNKAESIRKDNQNFADQNWTLENWIFNRFNTPSHIDSDRSWTSFPSLNKLSGTHDLKLIISGDLASALNSCGNFP